MSLYNYTKNKATSEDLQKHLLKCSKLFSPPLDSYVDIHEYSRKIKDNAVTIEAWRSNELIGLVAFYLNNYNTLEGYITNVSVIKDHQGMGIAKQLINTTIEEALNENFKTLSLEVEIDNKSALELYNKTGFVLNGRRGDKYLMINRLHEKRDITVSICCITYNHAKYINDTINGFLMQKTNFPIEILIHDDASTDGTADIIKGYEKKFPDVVKTIYQKENQYSQGRPISLVYQFPRARGKYIAICEGDDYWTDPLKLQKQVEFLESNLDCSLCFHASEHIQVPNPSDSYIHRPKYIPNDQKFEMEHVIRWGGSFVTTNSMLFLREHIIEPPYWVVNAPAGDLAITLLLALYGKIGYIDQVMSVYRRITPGSYSFRMQDQLKRKAHFLGMLRMWSDFDNWTLKKYHSLVVRKMMKNRWGYFMGMIKAMYR